MSSAQSTWDPSVYSQFIEARTRPAHNLLAEIESAGTTAVIPNKIYRIYPTDHDQHIYKERNIVERFFRRSNTLEGSQHAMIKLREYIYAGL